MVWRLGVPLRTESTPAVSLWQDGQILISRNTMTSIGIDSSEKPMTHWGCLIGGTSRRLHPLIERAKEGLNSVAASEWILIDVISDSSVCETVMPKGFCPNIRFRQSAVSKAGVEYEVASGKAAPNLG